MENFWFSRLRFQFFSDSTSLTYVIIPLFTVIVPGSLTYPVSVGFRFHFLIFEIGFTLSYVRDCD